MPRTRLDDTHIEDQFVDTEEGGFFDARGQSCADEYWFTDVADMSVMKESATMKWEHIHEAHAGQHGTIPGGGLEVHKFT